MMNNYLPAMAAFVVRKPELLKYTALEDDLCDLCSKIIKTKHEIVFVPNRGSIATVGLVLLNHDIAYNLDFDGHLLRLQRVII